MRDVACGPKEEPYNLWLGAELLIGLGVRRGSQPLWAPGSGTVTYSSTAVHTVPNYIHHINVDTM